MDKSLITGNASRCPTVGNLNGSIAQLTDDSPFPEGIITHAVREKLLETGYLPIYIPLYCVRIFQVQYMTVNSFANGVTNWIVLLNHDNRLEHIDLSYSSVSPRGWSMTNITVLGLNKLEKLILRGANINKIFNINLTDAHSLTIVDLSQNPLETMSDEEFSLMFSQKITARNLNFSSCIINHLPQKFLWQFPYITVLDLSNNKLKDMNFDLSSLNHGDNLTLNLSRNYLTSLNDSFIQNIESENQKRIITLLLFNNTFRCDCDRISFVRWFLRTNVTIEDKETVSCSYRGGVQIKIKDVDVRHLEIQCTVFLIAFATALPIGLITLVIWILCFRFCWHLRWYWYQMKQQLLCLNYGKVTPQNKKKYACYVNYFGVDDQWIMEKLIMHIEDWDIGDVCVFGRDAIPGIPIFDNIMEAINQSEKLLYIIGRVPDTGEVEWFHASLRCSTIERLEDIYIIYKDLVPFLDLLHKVPILKSLLKPKKNSPIKVIQLEANDMFLPELKQCLAQNEKDNKFCL